MEIITQAEPPMNMVDSLLCAISNTSTSRKPDTDIKENVKMNISIPQSYLAFTFGKNLMNDAMAAAKNSKAQNNDQNYYTTYKINYD